MQIRKESGNLVRKLEDSGKLEKNTKETMLSKTAK